MNQDIFVPGFHKQPADVSRRKQLTWNGNPDDTEYCFANRKRPDSPLGNVVAIRPIGTRYRRRARRISQAPQCERARYQRTRSKCCSANPASRSVPTESRLLAVAQPRWSFVDVRHSKCSAERRRTTPPSLHRNARKSADPARFHFEVVQTILTIEETRETNNLQR